MEAKRAELLKVVMVGWTLVRDDSGQARDLEGRPVTCYSEEEVVAQFRQFQSEVAQVNEQQPLPNRQQRRSRKKEAT